MIDKTLEDELHFDCNACWANVCTQHELSSTLIKVRVLLSNYKQLAARFEEARLNLADALNMPLNTEMHNLIIKLKMMKIDKKLDFR